MNAAAGVGKTGGEGGGGWAAASGTVSAAADGFPLVENKAV